MKIAIGVFTFLAQFVLLKCYSMIESNFFDSRLGDLNGDLSDLDFGLYGKPVCVDIPSNMSLCHNINYKQMKVPNLLGHETLDEVRIKVF